MTSLFIATGTLLVTLLGIFELSMIWYERKQAPKRAEALRQLYARIEAHERLAENDARLGK